jgi:threonine dehydratase
MTHEKSSAGLTLEKIKEVRRSIEDAIYCSPCPHSVTLSSLSGCEVYSKLENLQMTGSFKERGALAKLLTLTEEERKRGVIAASAGNHAQGVAYHAERLGIAATIVMPEYTPIIKVINTRRSGAKVVVHGANYDAACSYAFDLQKENGCIFVHPFNDYDVMAGQGTIGLEILEEVPDVDAVIVPVGGGGLIAGVATAIKESKPEVRVIGVQSRCMPSMKASLEEDSIVCIRPEGRTIADGIAVRTPGDLTFPIIQRYVDKVVTADDDEIANAILLLLEIEKTVVEGAGAIPLAAVLNRNLDLKGKKVVLVLSGGNIDVNMLSVIIRRGLVSDGRLIRLKVLLRDQPGMLWQLSELLANSRANILEITHHRTFTSAALGEVEVDLDLETEGADHVSKIIRSLEDAGHEVQRVE